MEPADFTIGLDVQKFWNGKMNRAQTMDICLNPTVKFVKKCRQAKTITQNLAANIR